MKKTLLALALLSLCSCNCKKSSVSDNAGNNRTVIESACPENGKCTVAILKNKSLVYKADEFGTGYYILEDNPKTSVIQYQYNQNVEEGLQDGNHKEEVLLEINNENQNLSLTDLELQKTNMIFGRICFCRGQTGYYKITKGNLKLTKSGATVSMDLDFKISEVPQLYHKIKVSLK